MIGSDYEACPDDIQFLKDEIDNRVIYQFPLSFESLITEFESLIKYFENKEYQHHLINSKNSDQEIKYNKKIKPILPNKKLHLLSLRLFSKSLQNKVIKYWKNKQKKLKRPLLRKYWKLLHQPNQNFGIQNKINLAFAPQPKINKRITKTKSLDQYNQIYKDNKNILLLISLINYREKLKLANNYFLYNVYNKKSFSKDFNVLIEEVNNEIKKYQNKFEIRQNSKHIKKIHQFDDMQVSLAKLLNELIFTDMKFLKNNPFLLQLNKDSMNNDEITNDYSSVRNSIQNKNIDLALKTFLNLAKILNQNFEKPNNKEINEIIENLSNRYYRIKNKSRSLLNKEYGININTSNPNPLNNSNLTINNFENKNPKMQNIQSVADSEQCNKIDNKNIDTSLSQKNYLEEFRELFFNKRFEDLSNFENRFLNLMNSSQKSDSKKSEKKDEQ